jgi:hypothetical protein
MYKMRKEDRKIYATMAKFFPVFTRHGYYLKGRVNALPREKFWLTFGFREVPPCDDYGKVPTAVTIVTQRPSRCSKEYPFYRG